MMSDKLLVNLDGQLRLILDLILFPSLGFCLYGPINHQFANTKWFIITTCCYPFIIRAGSEKWVTL